MAGLSTEALAHRAGVDAGYVERLTAAGVLVPADGSYTETDARRIRIMLSLEEAGLTIDSISAGIRAGLVDFAFVDGQEYDRFAAVSPETFRDASERTGVPVEKLLVIREAMGTGAVNPDERLSDDEQQIVPFIALQHQLGFSAQGTERFMRATADSLRRVAEAEAEWWRSEVTEPRIAEGKLGSAVGGSDISKQLAGLALEAISAVYRSQEVLTWTANIADGFSHLLRNAGLHDARERPPAICFLDITGYTRLTQERGDRAAAELAEELARLVQRSSVSRGGRPVKWLGDGVMFHFRESAPAVDSALEMVEGIAAGGMPPAHVGLHAGPIVVQQGDYYGQTVNMAARIADYARPGEVLVSRAIVDAASGQGRDGTAFSAIGGVELKGVVGTTELFVARRP
jgi:class 3 adenylate cyclase